MQEWAAKQDAAERMIPVVGRLYRNNDVLLTVYGRSLLNKSVNGIIKAHRYARHFDGTDLDIAVTGAIVDELESLNLGSCRIDLGRLAADYREAGDTDLTAFLRAQLADAIGGADDEQPTPQDVVLLSLIHI